MSTGYFKAIEADGYVHLRSTASRAYTHAVTRGAQSKASWAGRPDLARKTQAAWPGSHILEAVEITAQEYRALYKAKQPERDAAKAAWEASKAQWREKNAAVLAKYKEREAFHELIISATAKEPADRTPEEAAALAQALAD